MASDGFYNLLKRLDSYHKVALGSPVLTAPLRFCSFLLYRALELVLGKRHPHGRVVAQAKSMVARQTAPPREVHRTRVLFFTVRGWFVHATTEAVLAKALQLRHARVAFFLCGGKLDQCDFKPPSERYVTRSLCWRCRGFAVRLLDAFDLPYITLNSLVGPSVHREARQVVARTKWAELTALDYHGLPLYEYVVPSVLRSLCTGDIRRNAVSERVLRGYLQTAIVMTEACETLLATEQPDVVVMTNGLFSAERIMLESARRKGVSVVTYERGMPANSILLDHNRPACWFDLEDFWPAVRGRPLASEQNERLDAYLEQRAAGNVGIQQLWPTMDTDRQGLLQRFRLDPNKPLAVMFTNILWDTAVFGRDVAYDGMSDWVASTIQAFADWPEAQLLIRVHPSEVRLAMQESRDRIVDRIASSFSRLPRNVRMVAPDDVASSYALMQLARFVLVYTSTIGLEAAVRGSRVIVGGRPHYRGRGFTWDVNTREDYPQLLRAAVESASASLEERELARRYAFLFFFQYMQSFPWVSDWPRGGRRLEFESIASLAPGADAGLDRICRGILEGTPFVTFE